jgi:hypothetical protein
MAVKNFYGSICLTDLNNLAKQQHPSIQRGKNGKLYIDVSLFEFEEQDQYNNIGSIQAKTSKEEPNIYIGNYKRGRVQETPKVEIQEDEIPNEDDLPF